MQSDKTCLILEQYLAYLLTIKGRSQNTILEYRMDVLQFFRYVASKRAITETIFQFVDVDFIRSIQLSDIYGFIAYHQETLHNSPGTRCRKIVSIQQFWKYLKSKAHIIDNNIAEELETPKLPKRIVRCMTLEESVRLLIEANSSSIRDYCIITIFLNCGLRLSELASLDVDQVDSDVLQPLSEMVTKNERFILRRQSSKPCLNGFQSGTQWVWIPTRYSFPGTINDSQHVRFKTLLKSILQLLASILKACLPISLGTHPQL